MEVHTLIENQKIFFNTGKTKSLAFRLRTLTRLESVLEEMEQEVCQALYKDLHKSKMEAYLTEIGMTKSVIRYTKKHLAKWMQKKVVPTPLAQFPASSFSIAEPYGVVLIIAPWNYPFLLSMEPMIGAIAAGNCVVIKPSEYASETSRILCQIINRACYPSHVAVVEGAKEVSKTLLQEHFDYIFFTGSVEVGKMVMQAAANNLTPVSLELGGKSPCIVDETANLSLAAKRIVFGKFLNCGQTCVAPDYILVQEKVAHKLIQYMKYWIRKFYGNTPLENPDYPKMINEKHFARMRAFLAEGHILVGGNSNADTLQIEPTIMNGVSMKQKIMQEEIFGPILPVIVYKEKRDILRWVQQHEKPLALYLFTRNREMEKWVLSHISYGGGCINDTVIHLASPYLPFGGVGASGMGAYHGRYTFETFSHRKSIIKKREWLDLPLRYPPYTKQKMDWVKKLLQ